MRFYRPQCRICEKRKETSGDCDKKYCLQRPNTTSSLDKHFRNFVAGACPEPGRGVFRMYRIAIIQFPGSNCESESIRAVRAAGMEAEEFLWNEDYRKLENYDGYFIVGGFSYEDRSRSGIIAALDPIMPVIAAEAKKGKPVLGVCNGAQILVETGLVPGLKDNQVGI